MTKPTRAQIQKVLEVMLSRPTGGLSRDEQAKARLSAAMDQVRRYPAKWPKDRDILIELDRLMGAGLTVDQLLSKQKPT